VTRLAPETARLRPVLGPGSLPPSGRPARPLWAKFWAGADFHLSPGDGQIDASSVQFCFRSVKICGKSLTLFGKYFGQQVGSEIQFGIGSVQVE